MGLVRHTLLAASHSAWLRDQVTRYTFVRRAVSRFMPGEDLDAALSAALDLRPHGLATVLTQLGENLTKPEDAEQVRYHYLDVLDRVASLGLDAHVSVKPTQLGLDLGPAACLTNLSLVARRAAALGNFVSIDMESSQYTDATLDLYRRVRRESENVGVCLQAYLYRTDRDLTALLPIHPTIRLVKGAYLEPRDKAFPRKKDVDRNYMALAGRLLGGDAQRAGVKFAFATHDAALIERICAQAEAAGLAKDSIEFQFLYGIQTGEQLRLAREGYRVRVLISYGTAWFAWYMRRLAERPANLWFVARNLVAS